MRTSFTLYCEDRQMGKGEWQFQCHKDGMNVLDPAGRVVCWFRHKSAEDLFTLPSFWRSVKHIVFATDRGMILHFEPDPKDVRKVREYLDSALLAGGIKAVKKLQQRAWFAVAGGLALFVISLLIAYLLDQVLQLQDSKRYARPFFVGAIVGVGLFGWGVHGVVRFSSLVRRWREETD